MVRSAAAINKTRPLMHTFSLQAAATFGDVASTKRLMLSVLSSAHGLGNATVSSDRHRRFSYMSNDNEVPCMR